MEHQHKEIMHTIITTIQQCYGFHGNRISTTGSMKSHANKSNQTLITVSSQWVKSLFTRSSRKSFIRKYHAKEWQCLYILKKKKKLAERDWKQQQSCGKDRIKLSWQPVKTRFYGILRNRKHTKVVTAEHSHTSQENKSHWNSSEEHSKCLQVYTCSVHTSLIQKVGQHC